MPTQAEKPKVKWVDERPSNERRSSSFYDAIIEQLKQSPGQFAVVDSTVKEGKPSSYILPAYTALRRRGAEIRQRTEGKKILLYASWPKGKK